MSTTWMHVAAHRHRLTRELAEGADPGSSPERALRAAQLTSERRRRQLAGTFRGIIRDAHERPQIRTQVVIFDRAAVLDAEEAINALIVRLSDPDPVCAEGMAMIQRMLTNADRSPLYNPGIPGALRRQLLVATAALDAAPRGQRALATAA